MFSSHKQLKLLSDVITTARIPFNIDRSTIASTKLAVAKGYIISNSKRY